MKKLLIISVSTFYGGGESFITNTLTSLQNYFDVYYIVRDGTLYDFLPKNKRYKFKNNSFINQINEVKEIINKLSISITILNGGRTLFFTPFLKNKTKNIMYVHSTNKSVPVIKRLIYILLIHYCYIFANKVIHVSDYSKNQQKIVNKNSIRIYNGVDILPYKERSFSLPLRFLFLGRTGKSKGIDIIIKSFEKIPENTAILNIVGSGEYDNKILKLKNKNIFYHGFKKDTSFYYDSNDIFITLSKIENCSLSILDALNNSMPVITTRAGGNVELVNAFNGFLIKRNVKILLHTINEIIQNPNCLIELGKNANKTAVNKFNKSDTVLYITDVINSL